MEDDGESDDYNHMHERFISNGTGSDSPIEILSISTIPHLAVILSGLLIFSINQILHDKQLFCEGSKSFWGLLYLLDFGISTIPLLLSLTCMSEDWLYILLSLSLLVVVWFALVKNSKKIIPRPGFQKAQILKKGPKAHKKNLKSEVPVNQGSSQNFANMVIPTGKVIDYITNYRSSMLLVTAICILAVDFPIFPRRFGKTENFGFGLMDIGVGSFVFANGLVSSEARKGTSEIKQNRLKYLGKTLSKAIPMLILGFLRFASVKASGYHEHVSEYGLHWNFFFTLAFTEIMSSLVFVTSFPIKWSWIVAIMLAAFHETYLGLGLSEWILENDASDRSHHDLISANREGLVSVGGYLALHIAGVAWGNEIFSKTKTLVKHYTQDAVVLMQWAFLMWSSLYSSMYLQVFLPPSRRLANWTYVNWMIAYNLTLILLFLLCYLLLSYCQYLKKIRTSLHDSIAMKDTPTDKSSSSSQSSLKRKKHRNAKENVNEEPENNKSIEGTESTTINATMFENTEFSIHIPVIFSAIHFNGLVYFLLANLLTGIINKTLPTIQIDGCPAVLIICAYLAILNAIIVIMHRMKIKVL